jgi:hypothetical protein
MHLLCRKSERSNSQPHPLVTGIPMGTSAPSALALHNAPSDQRSCSGKFQTPCKVRPWHHFLPVTCVSDTICSYVSGRSAGLATSTFFSASPPPVTRLARRRTLAIVWPTRMPIARSPSGTPIIFNQSRPWADNVDQSFHAMLASRSGGERLCGRRYPSSFVKL